MKKFWIKSSATLIILFLMSYFIPAAPIDPWNLLSLKKISNIIFALVFIQVIGSALIHYFGPKLGAILAGFLGGLVSSTATTATLARKSKTHPNEHHATENLIFLSASFAMLVEALAISVYSISEMHLRLIFLIGLPGLAIISLGFVQSKSAKSDEVWTSEMRLDILPILKLSIFVIGIITISKLFASILGQTGLLLMTFVISLFEVHGSIIANLQLHEAGSINEVLLGNLLATSILATMLSKLFLVSSLGSPIFKKAILKITALLILSLIVGWAAFRISLF